MRIRSVLLGSVSTVFLVVAIGVTLGYFVAHGAPAIGDPGWKQSHNQLIGLTSVKILTVATWCIAAFFGGVVAGFVAEDRVVLHALAAGSLVAVLWGAPSAIIAGTNLSLVHLLSIAAIFPFSALGGYAVTRLKILKERRASP